ncbi:hypothetical protein [Methanobrevibacter filiformis]|nr:hypothetical protein [Methanobrevibacter filiformis]
MHDLQPHHIPHIPMHSFTDWSILKLFSNANPISSNYNTFFGYT